MSSVSGTRAAQPTRGAGRRRRRRLPRTPRAWPACRLPASSSSRLADDSSVCAGLPGGRHGQAQVESGSGMPDNTSRCCLSLRSSSLLFATWTPRCASAPAGRGRQSPGARGWGVSQAGGAWLPALVPGRARRPSPLAEQTEAPAEQTGERGDSGVGTAIRTGSGPASPLCGPPGPLRYKASRGMPGLAQRSSRQEPASSATQRDSLVQVDGWIAE